RPDRGRAWRLLDAARGGAQAAGQVVPRRQDHPADRGRDRRWHPQGDRAMARHVRQLSLTLWALAALLAPAAPARADLQALEAAGRQEGQLTWYISQIDAETAELAGRTFTQLHPGITVNVVRTTTQVAYQRVTQDLRENAPQCDVYSTTDVGH